MAGRVGVLRPEGRSEGVYVAEGLGEGLDVELARNRHINRLSEEILAEIDLTVFRERYIVERECGYLEHLAGTLRVGRRDDRRVDIHEVALLEEFVDRVGDERTNAEHRLECIGAGTKMRHRAEELERVSLLLQRVIRGGLTLDRHLIRLNLKRLLCLRRHNQRSLNDDRRSDVQLADIAEVLHRVVEHDLQGRVK